MAQFRRPPPPAPLRPEAEGKAWLQVLVAHRVAVARLFQCVCLMVRVAGHITMSSSTVFERQRREMMEVKGLSPAPRLGVGSVLLMLGVEDIGRLADLLGGRCGGIGVAAWGCGLGPGRGVGVVMGVMEEVGDPPLPRVAGGRDRSWSYIMVEMRSSAAPDMWDCFFVLVILFPPPPPLPPAPPLLSKRPAILIQL